MKIEIHRVVLGLLALMTLGGCASLNDCCYEKTQSVRAVKEYIKCGHPECSSYPHDYKCGWIDGFYEVATGGDSCPPAVAPERYYKPEQILEHCDKKRHAYYSGWQDGASRASQFPDTHYIRIYETCECPFPRCDKPCGGGACGPCSAAFVGLTAAPEMIEVMSVPMPMPPAPIEYAEDARLQSSSNKDVETNDDDVSDAPLVEPQSRKAPANTKKTGVKEDAEAMPLPKPDADAFAPLPTLELEPAVKNRRTQADMSLVAIPGYQVTPAATRSTASPTKAKRVGLIRMIKPTQLPQQAQPVQQTQNIVFVANPNQPFEMIETVSVVKLVE